MPQPGGPSLLQPKTVIDSALAVGNIKCELRYVRTRAVELLQQEFTTEEGAPQFVEDVCSRHRKDFPKALEKHPEIFTKAKEYLNECQRHARGLLMDTEFRDPDISWRYLPDYSGHMDVPGCFRCHDDGIQHGTDDSSFCANSGCHDREWPSLQ